MGLREQMKSSWMFGIKLPIQLAPMLLALGMITSFQNCTPANFTAQESKVGKNGIDPEPPACTDPQNPECIALPPPSCEGFQAQPIGDLVIPFGQASQMVTVNGLLGRARGPIQWEVPGAVPATNVGLTVQFNVAPRASLYTVTARSSDNQCTSAFSFRVTQGSCSNPSATQIQSSIVTPVQDRLVNSAIRFSVPNFRNLQNVSVSFDNKQTYAPVTAAEFVHTYTSAGNFTVWLKAQDTTCGNQLEAQLQLTVLPVACVPDVTTLVAERVTADPRSGRPVEFRVLTDFSLLENNRVEVICDPGQVSYFGPGVPILCQYPASAQDVQKFVTIKAVAKKCRNPLETNFEFLLKKQCDALPALQMSVAPSQTVSPADNVQFTLSNASAYNRPGVTFSWNLGNGESGSGTSIPATRYPLTPAEEPLAASQGVIRNARFFVQSSDPTICVPNEARIPITIRLTPRSQQFVVGQQTTTPPVKMFFIVDNSNTMRDDQQRLSQSYSTLFSPANVNNLTQFDTSTWVFNTAQKTDRWMSGPATQWGSGQFSELEQYYQSTAAAKQTPEEIAQNASLNQIMTPLLQPYYDPQTGPTWQQVANLGTVDGARATSNGVDPSTPSSTFGHIAGDVIGYRNTALPYDQSYQFEVMPVSLFRAGAAGPNAAPMAVSRYSSLAKGANSSQVAQYAQAFTERIDVLNPFKYSSEKWDPILTQQESGLCAAARILQSDRYLQPGDQASFVIVSDEDDQDPAGDKCLSGSGNLAIEYGRCSSMGTRFGYQTAPLCRITYPTARNITYQFREFTGQIETRLCIQNDDQGQCIRYETRYSTVTLGGTSGDPDAYCRSWESQTPGGTCSYSNQQTSIERPLASGPATGACDAALEQQLVATVGTYVRGSCRVSGYRTTNDSVNLGAGATEASCRQELIRRESICSGITDQGVCRSQLVQQTATLEVPVTGLSCLSQCPVGMAAICGSGTVLEQIHRLSPGSNCSVQNANAPLTGTQYSGPEISFAPSVPVSTRCEAGKAWRPTRTVQQNTDTYVAVNHQGQRIGLKDYILAKINDLSVAGLKPTFSTFTLKPGDTPGAGESIGSSYIDLVNSIGTTSLSFSLNQNDFGYPMQVLSQYIRTVLSSIFDFSLPAGAQIRSVTWERTGQTARAVRSDSYRLGGGRLEFVDVDNAQSGTQIWLSDGTKISLQLNDRFNVTYY